jgi:Sec-independent protein secretion pathway component TatC
MGVPLVALYFLGIAMCKYLPRAAMQNPTVGEPT